MIWLKWLWRIRYAGIRITWLLRTLIPVNKLLKGRFLCEIDFTAPNP